MSVRLVKGFPSTSNNAIQLNTSTFIRSAATAYPEVEVVSRRLDGSLFRYTYGQAHERMQQMAKALLAATNATISAHGSPADSLTRKSAADRATARSYRLYAESPGRALSRF